jgi:tight adherence protein B
MMPKLLIAVLAGVSAGLFAWLVLQRLALRLVDYRNDLAATTESRFAEMFMFVDVARWINLYLALVLFLPPMIWILTRELWLGLATLILVLAGPYLALSLLRQRRLALIEAQLPDAIAMFAASLRAGASITSALDNLIQESSPPLSQEFNLLQREIRLGVDMDTALDHMEQRIPLEELRLLLAAIRISREVGGNLSETLDKLAVTLRAKLVMAGKIRSLTAQGRLQGMVMTLLPLVLIVILLHLEPATMGLLFSTRLGWAVLALVMVMQVLGFLTIRKITRIDI